MSSIDNRCRELIVSFEGKHVSLNSDEHSLMAAIADNKRQPTAYILFQRSVAPSQQDVELGHDQVHLEIGEQNRARYGGIERCVLSNKELRVKLKDDAAHDLGVKGDIRIGLDLTDSELRDLTVFLEDLFSSMVEFRRL